jgi:hypothetical protein
MASFKGTILVYITCNGETILHYEPEAKSKKRLFTGAIRSREAYYQ